MSAKRWGVPLSLSRSFLNSGSLFLRDVCSVSAEVYLSLSKAPGRAGRYRQAAAQGNARAQFNLGGCYAKGVGVAPDAKAANKWHRKAAHQGLAAAQYELALLHLQAGKGQSGGAGWSPVAPSQATSAPPHAEAAAWFRQAAEQGHAKVRGG